MTRRKSFPDNLTVQVLVIALSSRLLLLAMNWWSLKIFRVFDRGYPKLYDELIPANNPLAGWSRWDAAHYVRVAYEGYLGPNGEPVQTRGFFPLYPMLMRLLAWLSPGTATRADVAVWGVLLANSCFIAMVVVLAKLIAAQYDDEIALTATTLLIVSPMSFFFNAGYSESLFMLCVVVAFWFAYRQQWIGASVVIALASATRLFGLVLIPAILLIAWRHRAQLRDLILIPAIGLLGALSYVIWTWIVYDDAFAYWNAQATFWGNWQDRVGNYRYLLISDPLQMVRSPENAVITLNIMLAFLAIVTLPWVWKQVEPGMAFFTSMVVLFHTAYTWHSLGRYLLAAIGCYLVWGIWLSKPGWNAGVRTAVIVTSTIVLTTLNLLFAHGFWIV